MSFHNFGSLFTLLTHYIWIVCSRSHLIESLISINYIRTHTSTDTRRSKAVGCVKNLSKKLLNSISYILPCLFCFNMKCVENALHPLICINGSLLYVTFRRSIGRGGKSSKILSLRWMAPRRTFNFMNTIFGFKQISTTRVACMELVLRVLWWSKMLDIHFLPSAPPSSTTMMLEKWCNG